jgi:hypothetical protein
MIVTAIASAVLALFVWGRNTDRDRPHLYFAVYFADLLVIGSLTFSLITLIYLIAYFARGLFGKPRGVRTESVVRGKPGKPPCDFPASASER